MTDERRTEDDLDSCELRSLCQNLWKVCKEAVRRVRQEVGGMADSADIGRVLLAGSSFIKTSTGNTAGTDTYRVDGTRCSNNGCTKGGQSTVPI